MLPLLLVILSELFCFNLFKIEIKLELKSLIFFIIVLSVVSGIVLLYCTGIEQAKDESAESYPYYEKWEDTPCEAMYIIYCVLSVICMAIYMYGASDGIFFRKWYIFIIIALLIFDILNLIFFHKCVLFEMNFECAVIGFLHLEMRALFRSVLILAFVLALFTVSLFMMLISLAAFTYVDLRVRGDL